MRICLLSSDYGVGGTVAGGGGIETYVRLMARGLADAGHDVHVVASTSCGRRFFRDGRVHVHAIEVPNDWNGAAPELGEARAALSFAWHARRKVRSLMVAAGAFDLVEAPEYKGQGVFLADDPDVRLVVKCHAHLLLCLALNGVDLTPGTALIADLESETLRKAHAIHANSQALASRCAEDYGLPLERFTRIPCGIDTATFRPTPARLRERLGLERARILLFVGRMEERKGISTLVRAFADVAREVPDVVLLLAGPDVVGPPAHGSNVAWMCEQWEALGVSSDRFLFLGAVPNDALPAIYSSADVMVAPSAFEAFGLVYLEAMACGCPPVACRSGGAAEVILDGETGLLVPPEDPSALAQGLIDLLKAPGRRAAFARQGRTRVEREYTVGTMVTRTMRFYEEALA
jgi:glycosyltransferase involved in cell wall biosynthesis